MKYANAERFLKSYNKIESQLKILYGGPPTQAFTDLVKRCSDRNITVRHDLLCPRLVFHKDALHLLYLRAPLINCSRERYRTPYSERNSYLGHKDLMPCPVESGGDPCRQVPGSSDQYFHSSVSAFLLYRSSPA